MKTIHVVAAVILHEGKIFATRRGYGPYRGSWEFPGGKMEPGETPQEALVREIREELDLHVAVGDPACTVEYDYPDFHLSMQCFWCTMLSGRPKLLEHEAARWLDRNTLRSVNWLPADLTLLPEIEKQLAFIPETDA